MRLNSAFLYGFLTFGLLMSAVGAAAQESHPPSLVYDEARTVYLGNLARRDNGLLPLRWNRQLSEAARWFSWDSAENRPGGYCGHQDTQGHWPDWRVALSDTSVPLAPKTASVPTSRPNTRSRGG
jgi:hypothetical protein